MEYRIIESEGRTTNTIGLEYMYMDCPLKDLKKIQQLKA